MVEASMLMAIRSLKTYQRLVEDLSAGMLLPGLALPRAQEQVIESEQGVEANHRKGSGPSLVQSPGDLRPRPVLR